MSADRVAGGRWRRRRRAVLLVEDDAEVRELLASALRREGHSVTTAADAEEALAMLERMERDGPGFQVLVADVFLPGVSGFALAARASSLIADLHVIYMSGYPNPDPPPGVTVLGKPFSPEILLRTVQDRLGLPPRT